MKKFKSIFIMMLVLVSTLFLPSCTVTPPAELDPATFDDFTENIFKLVVGGDDMSINFLFDQPENFGLTRNDPVLPTPSAGSAIGTLVLNLYFKPLYQYDINKLNFDQQMTYHVIDDLIQNINSTVGMGYLSSDYLGSYLGYQAQLPILLVNYKIKTKDDVDKYLKYLEIVPDTFKQYVDFEVEKADHGYGMPDFVIDKVIDQCDSFIEEVNKVMDQHFMIEMFNSKINSLNVLTDEEKANYIVRNAELVRGPLCDGYAYVRNNLGVVRGRAVNEMGLAHYTTENGPIGKDYYQALFKKTTGYDIPVEDAIKYMDDKLAEKFLAYLTIAKNNPSILDEIDKIQLMTGTPEEQLAIFMAETPKYFPALEVEHMPEIEVRYVDKSMEDHFSPAAYMVSQIDTTNLEFIYLNNKSIHHTNENGESVLDYNYLYTTLAHEAFPGHMYQNIYFKNSDANILRKILKCVGYMEGWATYVQLYSYDLMKPKFGNDAMEFLKLNDEINGIIQARLDLGIHFEGWTKEEAESFLAQYISAYDKTKPNYVPGAIDRVYEQLVEVPTNSLEYFFTFLKIEDMLNYAKEIQGENFDWIEFNKILLDCGPVPLRYTEEVVKEHYAK